MDRRFFKQLPGKDLIAEWLHYCPLSGEFTWLKEPAIMPRNLGRVAGYVRKNGYRFICVAGYAECAANRLAWVYVHGEIPDGFEVDHIDVDPSNNAISNLRLATSSQQKQNRRVQSNNRSGLKGAYFHACRKGKKWRSQIKANGRYHFLGYFHTAEDAHAAYQTAVPKFFGEFARVA